MLDEQPRRLSPHRFHKGQSSPPEISLITVTTITICELGDRMIARGRRILVTFIRPLDADFWRRNLSRGGLAFV